MTVDFQNHPIHGNLRAAAETLRFAVSRGVRTFCLSPGARNAPWVQLLDAWVSDSRPLSLPKPEGVEVLNFFDERQASFFALGRIKKDRVPVALLTTSGTAVTELFSGVVEAYYSGLPLLVLSADRPRTYRGTGAPQAIEQAGIFGAYAPGSLDLEASNWEAESSLLEETAKTWSALEPLQINVCFSEPLLSGFSEGTEKALESLQDALGMNPMKPRVARSSSQGTASLKGKHPLVIVGALDSETLRDSVRQFLRQLPVPILLEASSGLRGAAEEFPGWIQGGESWVRNALKTGLIQSVLRIGGVPSYRFWRDLEDHPEVPVLSLSSLPFSGLARPSHLSCEGEEVLSRLKREDLAWERRSWHAFLEIEQHNREVRRNAVALFPESEPSGLIRLSQQIPDQAQIYLGNSLPIREWNGFVTPAIAGANSSQWKFFENRGANGIDGQLSTFFGCATDDCENWGIFGDLTTLYDLSAPWALRYLTGKVLRIGVINNSGGRIFERMFESPRFITQHEMGFADWAKLWSMEYAGVDRPLSSPVSVIEVTPDPEQTRRFWKYVEANSRSE